MRHHRTTLAALLVAGLLAAGLTAATSPAQAAGTSRLVVPEEYDAVEHLAADDNLCGPWAANFHEIRHGQYTLLFAPGGRAAGEAHVNGSVDGWVELAPDDPSLPTYSGDYREKVDGVLLDPANDQFRVFHFALRDRLHGTDGSTLTIQISGKMTVTPDGRAVVDRSISSCD